MYLLRAVVAGIALATVVGNIIKDGTQDLLTAERLTADEQEPIELVDLSSPTVDVCYIIKKFLEKRYEGLVGEEEPDLNKITLEYRTSTFRKVYNITDVKEILVTPQYNSNQDLIIFLDQYLGDSDQHIFDAISGALLNRGESSVLMLESKLLPRKLYLRLTTYIRLIGEKLGETLAELVNNGVDPKRIYIIGYSFGAHIAGFTGKKFTELTGKHIGRITGLDPIGPCFNNVEEAVRLNPNDADYVDVIHTNSGLYGFKDACGQADYFVNGGSEQPDCVLGMCSHNRAWELYVESVKNEKAFPAVKCTSWAQFKDERCDYNDISYMGFGSKPGNGGQYYLQTNRESPYGRGEKGLKYTSNRGILFRLLDMYNPF